MQWFLLWDGKTMTVFVICEPFACSRIWCTSFIDTYGISSFSRSACLHFLLSQNSECWFITAHVCSQSKHPNTTRTPSLVIEDVLLYHVFRIRSRNRRRRWWFSGIFGVTRIYAKQMCKHVLSPIPKYMHRRIEIHFLFLFHKWRHEATIFETFWTDYTEKRRIHMQIYGIRMRWHWHESISRISNDDVSVRREESGACCRLLSNVKCASWKVIFSCLIHKANPLSHATASHVARTDRVHACEWALAQ